MKTKTSWDCYTSVSNLLWLYSLTFEKGTVRDLILTFDYGVFPKCILHCEILHSSTKPSTLMWGAKQGDSISPKKRFNTALKEVFQQLDRKMASTSLMKHNLTIFWWHFWRNNRSRREAEPTGPRKWKGWTPNKPIKDNMDEKPPGQEWLNPDRILKDQRSQ